MQTAHESHWKAAKRILHYVHGTVQFDRLQLKGDSLLVGFTDSDWVGDPDDENSTTGYVFSILALVKKQQTISLSSAKAEY
jgi:hypothetical protein